MRAGCRATTRLRLPERRRRNRRVLAAVLLLSLAAWGLTRLAGPASRTLGTMPLFQAGRVEVTGLHYLSRDEVRSAIAVRDGESLFRVRPAEIERTLSAILGSRASP